MIRQVCDSLDVQILKGVLSKDHIQVNRSGRLMLDESWELKRRYWGMRYGARSTGNITDEMIQEYLNHHKKGYNTDQNFILE